jgi:hypothetical protein
LPVSRHAPICPTFVAARKIERGAEPSSVAAGASSLSDVAGRLVDDALCLPRKTYEKETFAAIDFRASLPVTSPKSLLCFGDSNRPRITVTVYSVARPGGRRQPLGPHHP